LFSTQNLVTVLTGSVQNLCEKYWPRFPPQESQFINRRLINYCSLSPNPSPLLLNLGQTDNVAARSKAWVCGRALAGIVDSNPNGGMDFFVYCTVFVLSGRGLCDGPIPRPEESYRLCCVFECDHVKIKSLCTCCEQGKDYETKRIVH
jgi:hypothetical protein